MIFTVTWWSDLVNLWGASEALGNWTGIIGLGITIYLLITTNGIKEKMQRVVKFKDFKRDKKSLISDLNSSIELIISDPTDSNNAVDLMKTLRKLEDYKPYMSKKDVKSLKGATKIVEQGITFRNKNELTTLLASLVGFLELRQEFDMNNL